MCFSGYIEKLKFSEGRTSRVFKEKYTIHQTKVKSQNNL